MRKEIYNLSDKNLITISTHSTFGLENLARLNKTAIFNNKVKSSNNLMNVFWNYDLPKNGFFWSDENFDFKKVEKILNNLLKMKNRLWIKKSKKITSLVMSYDYKNKKLIDLIKKLLKLTY